MGYLLVFIPLVDHLFFDMSSFFTKRTDYYCQSLIRRPGDTSLILISDLYEGGLEENLLRCASDIMSAGSNMITLLALSDEGAPSYDRQNAARLASLGIPAFACTPDLFPDLMAAALQKQDLSTWVAKHDPPTQKT